ncbi:MAG: restriction endonuclease subunit S [Bellilinea sp.]
MSSKGWEKYKLEDVAEIVGGGTPSTSNPDYWGQEIPWVTPRDLAGTDERFICCGERSITKKGLQNSSARLLPAGTVLLTTRAPIGYLRIALNQICTNQGFKSLIPKVHIADNHFLFYLLKNNIEHLKSVGVGTTFAEISGTVLRQIEFLFPPLPTQRRIAEILSALDDKIELNRQTNATLEAIAQAIFKEWFVDFNFPGASGETVESELGMIPRGWRVGRLEEIITNFDRKRVPLSSRERENRKGIFPYYGAASILDYIDDYLFDGVYLLMGEDGTVITEDEKPILQYVSGKFWVNNHTHVLRGKGIFSTEYIFLVLKNTSVKHIVTGAVQPKINQGNMNNLSVIIPDTSTLRSYQDIVRPFFENILEIEQETATLSSIRDALLPKLMNGEIYVSIGKENPDE